MPRRACLFKKTDVTRAIDATRAAGVQIGRVEIDKEGNITIVPVEAVGEHINELDRELEAFEQSNGKRAT